MMFFPVRRLLVLFLAAFVVLGLSLASIPTGARPDMTMSGKMDMADQADCPHCKYTGDGGKALACGSVCVAPVMAVLPAASFLNSDLKTIAAFKRMALPYGR